LAQAGLGSSLCPLAARESVIMWKLLGSLSLIAGASALKVDERPIAKVVNLLKDMGDQLQKEAEADEEAFAAFNCWCETNEKEKTGAIKVNTQRTNDLASSIEESAAQSQRLTGEIAALKTQVEEQTKSLSEATALRTKELAEFNAEEKDMIQSITGLKGAVITLGKAHGEAASLLQVQELLKHPKYGRRMSLLQTSSKSKTPASGEIFGMLKQMKEEFETNLAGSKKEETQAAAEYAQLKEAKTSELTAANGQIDAKTVNLGDSDEAHAQAKQDLKDTEASLAADQAFLADMRPKCAQGQSEYDARVKVRTEEIQAVSETMGILTSDEANDSFTKSMSFIQKSLKLNNGKREKAISLLRLASKKSPQLMTLALSLRLDAFAKVKENIDNMVVALKTEQGDEVTDRDFCIKELNQNERQAAAKNDAKSDLDQKIADLTSQLSDLEAAIKALAEEVTATQVSMKKANANREAENKEFSMTVQDQQATQAILKKALDRLAEFYAKKAAFLQDEGIAPTDPNAMPEMGVKRQTAGGGGVIAMIEGVVNESKDLETKALSAEQDSQAAYEGFIKDSNKLINANNQDIANKSDVKAKADIAKVQAEGDLKATITDILALADMAKEIHGQCDFLLKNFDERQSSRSQEIDALNQAKAIFSGMK